MFSEINHSAPISETNTTKFTFSAILTPICHTNMPLFIKLYAKTSLARYLL